MLWIVKIYLFIAFAWSASGHYSNIETDSLGYRTRLYTYDEIVKLMQEETHNFFRDAALLHNMKYALNKLNPDGNEMETSTIPSTFGRVKRSLIENQHVPNYLRDGTWPLFAVTESGWLYAGHKILDVFTLSFNNQHYVLCLTVQDDRRFYLIYGPPSNVTKLDVILDNPRKILAFTFHNSGFEDLVVLILNEKNHVDNNDVMWFQINQRNENTHRNYLKTNRLIAKNSVVWPDKSTIILHDRVDSNLKVYKYVGTYFDLQFNYSISKDLSSICPFSYKGISYLLLGFQNTENYYHPPKDVLLMSLNIFSQRLEEKQSIQVFEDVLDIQYFTIGHNKQSIFLALVQRSCIVFYKFLDSYSGFRIFQRIYMNNIRKVVTYGNADNLFVMAVIAQTNDVTLITFNSFRFLVSNVQRRVFILPPNPVVFYRFSPQSPTIKMLIGTVNGIQTYEYTFVHDTSLMQQWHNNMEWCWTRRDETLAVEERTSVVQTRFSEAFLKNQPLVINGTITVPSYIGIVTTGDYRRDTFTMNSNYFEQLRKMQDFLNRIDQRVNQGYHRLTDSLQVQTTDIQKVTGNYVFQNIKILNYYPNRNYPEMINLNTPTLNSHSVNTLKQDTVRLDSTSQIGFFKALKFERIIQHSSGPLHVNVLINNAFNISDIVTSSGDHMISGIKRFANCFLVDESIFTDLVNHKNFTRETVLLTSVEQTINNPVAMHAKMVRTNVLNAKIVNGEPLNAFFDSIVKKDDKAQITSPVEFTNGLELYDLFVDANAQLNGHIVDDLLEDVVWLNQANQSIWGDFQFLSNVTINGNLFVKQVNQRSIPEDLILANQMNVIKGVKRFESLSIHRLNLTNSLNELQIINGMPDILLKFVPQNITGSKIISGLHISNHSFIQGLVNSLSLQELQKRSQERPQIRLYDKLYIENFADFAGGFYFERFNSLHRSQFNQLMQHSLGIDQNWDFLHLGDVTFDKLTVNILDCKKINNLNLDNDLLTRNTSQTISSSFAFNKVLLEGPSIIQTVNNFSMKRLENVFRTYGNQELEFKVFGSDIHLKSLKVHSINSIPVDDIVFMDEFKSKIITGAKLFKGQNLQFDYLSTDDLNTNSINNINVNGMLKNTLQRTTPQNVPRHIQFSLLQLEPNQDFRSYQVNGVNLYDLQKDLVMIGGNDFKNVTGRKIFTGVVNFDSIEFVRLFDGVTTWEMTHNWMVQNLPQRVDANFSIEILHVPKVFVHNGVLNGIDLDLLERTVVRLDQKTVIHSECSFIGEVILNDDILLNGKLNKIDLRKDVLYTKYNGIQTLRGDVRLLSNVFVHNNIDLNGFVNGVNVPQMCSTAYRPEPNRPLIINGDVQIMAPARIDVINNITYVELRDQTIRHDLKDQIVTGNLIIDSLVLNGQVQLNQMINNVKLEHLSNTYMSKTKNQIIDCSIILQSNQEFTDDIVVNNFYIENGIVDRVNLTQIDESALRVDGNQHYTGDIDFDADVAIDLNLNSQWLNGVNTNYLMQKNRQVHRFLEETIFTRNFTVIDNLNIVNGNRISGVNIEMMRKNAVQRDAVQNYTIRGVKTFDSVHVYTIHTAKLNQVEISKQNLLLRSDTQTITGQISFAGNVVVNTSLVDEINKIRVTDFQRNIAKKNGQNVIHSPVHFQSLNIGKVEVRDLIDNVNISIFKTISTAVGHLETLGQYSNRSKRQFESFEKQLNFVLAKFIFYERYLSVYANNLPVDQIRSPFLVTSIFNHLAVVLPGKQSDCYEVDVFLKNEINGHSWNKLTLYIPFPVISVHQAGDHLIVSSDSTPSSHVNVTMCLLKNRLPKDINVPSKNVGVLFQLFRILPNVHAVSLSKQVYPKTIFSYPKVLQMTSNQMTVCTQESCTLVCLDYNCGNDPDQSTIPFSGHIRKVYNHKETILVSTLNNLVTIIKMKNNKLTIVQSIPMLNAKLMLVVDNMPTYEYSQYILIAEGRKSQLVPLIHVYATKDGTHYNKVQEINENVVHNMKVFYAKSNYREPYVLLQKEEEIIIYQLIPTKGFKRHSQIKLGESLQWIHVTNRNYLALYFADNCPNSDYVMNPYIELFKPRYHQEISYGTESLVIESDNNTQIYNKHERKKSETKSSEQGTVHL